jgi:hypothetical protein
MDELSKARYEDHNSTVPGKKRETHAFSSVEKAGNNDEIF